MSSNKQHIKDNLTRDDIQGYLSSTDESKKRIIEEKSLNSDFNSDALEGWSTADVDVSIMKKLDKKFKSTASILKPIILSSVILLVVVFGYYYYNVNSDVLNQDITKNVEKTDIILPDSVQKLEVLSENKLIKINEIKIEKKTNKESTQTVEQQKTAKENLSVDQLPILKPDFPIQANSIHKVTAKEIYLNNLKLIDYRKYRSRSNIKVESLELTGIPANLESKDEQVKDSKSTDSEIAYYDYIKKTTLLLSEGDYKQTLARCNIILSHYPNDLNALFYSGYCYYNLAEYSKSVELFKQCLTSNYNNFDEESEWLLAKSYEALGENNKAKAIFKLINDRGGYYRSK